MENCIDHVNYVLSGGSNRLTVSHRKRQLTSCLCMFSHSSSSNKRNLLYPFGTFGHTSKKDEEAEILSTYLGQYPQTALTLDTGIKTLPDDLS